MKETNESIKNAAQVKTEFSKGEYQMTEKQKYSTFP